MEVKSLHAEGSAGREEGGGSENKGEGDTGGREGVKIGERVTQKGGRE